MKTVIIGGGTGGLALAYRLVQRGTPAADITVLEATSRWGGVTRSSREDGFTLEHGPDSIVRIKPAGVGLWRELGLESEFQPTEPAARHALIAKGRRLLPVPEGLYLLAPGKLLPFALSPLLSWRGKLRAGMDLILPRRAEGAPEESLAQFVSRRMGREVLARIAQPLVGGIYTADPEKLSVAATMPQFIQWEREHRSLILASRARSKAMKGEQAAGPRYGLFLSLRGGLARMSEALRERLAGADLRLDAPVAGLARGEAGWRVRLADGGTLDAARVAICAPAWAAAALTREADAELATELEAIPYAGCAILNLAYRAADIPALPPAAGFVVPSIENRAVLAVTFMSSKYAGRAPEGTVLLRIFLGGAQRERTLDRDDAALVQLARDELRDLLGITAEPILSRLYRWPRAMAQYHLGHQDRVARIRAREARLPGLALVGNGYEGVGIPDIIAQADAAAARWLPK